MNSSSHSIITNLKKRYQRARLHEASNKPAFASLNHAGLHHQAGLVSLLKRGWRVVLKSRDVEDVTKSKYAGADFPVALTL